MRISVFGMGLMGTPIALKLAQENFLVTAYNRTAEKLNPLEEQGLTVTTNPQTAIANSDYLILTLSDAAAIQTVLLENADTSFTGKTIIQMGTIAPEESKAIAKAVQERQGQYLEAPVLGSIPEAKKGTLLVMVGGEETLFQACLPIFKTLGQDPKYIGAVGQAAALKLALNQLIAGLTASFSLSLGLIQREKVDLDKFMGILRDSALYAPTFDKKLPRMGDRTFANPNFPTKHLLKDTRLFLAAAKTVGLETTGLEGIREIIEQAIALNLAEADYSAIYQVINPDPTP
ncbi:MULTISPECIES: NAD(P)-dependent oxidoreductase [Cyanophyceae]|uniref:NAD(P)-dependent oxidoreductase n=1 Tax=Cyanophyceae TaxID=3028117 RepID=UPI000810B7BC|nr:MULTISPECIES: NAD(P)-dependent oxidoreductase [Cyanophyceae]ANV91691.1 hydroxyacid dehydrogenase [Picosynechococcus sp. PCC 8807]